MPMISPAARAETARRFLRRHGDRGGTFRYSQSAFDTCERKSAGCSITLLRQKEGLVQHRPRRCPVPFPVTLRAIPQLACRTSAKWTKPLIILLVLLAGLSVYAAGANADSIELISVFTSGGQTNYNYGISTTALTSYAVGDTIQFSSIQMLSGSGDGGALVGFSVSENGNIGLVLFIANTPISLAAGGTYEVLGISSFSQDMGLIHYVSTSDPMFSGYVEGPVALTPEPSSVLLFGSGILTLIGITLRSKRLA
jgi:hypothetical protein